MFIIKKSKVPSVHRHDAIENALCYGWVDSKAKSRDKESCYLKFTPRNKKSKWGKKNKERAQKMIANGLMTEHGQQLIDWAKDTGKWIRTNTKINYKFFLLSINKAYKKYRNKRIANFVFGIESRVLSPIY